MRKMYAALSAVLLLLLIVSLSGCEAFFNTYVENAPEAYDGTLEWTKETEHAAWSNRLDHASVVFDDKLWVIGGYDPTQRGSKDSYMEDVWYSADGITWNLATDDAPWNGRRGHAVVALGTKMYLLGGYSRDEETGSVSYKNDVWETTDGVTWTEVTSSAAWRSRMNHAALVSDGSIYIIGGMYDSIRYLDDVWKSSDGINWTQAASGTIGERGSMAATVDDSGYLYIQGGQYPDFIPADEGRTDPAVSNWSHLWRFDTSSPAWGNQGRSVRLTFTRMEHQLVYLNGKIWQFAGKSNTSYRFSSTNYHYSTQVFTLGTGWSTDSLGSGFGPRYSYTALTFDPDGNGNRIWVLGGLSDNGPTNDVWSAVEGD